jgi:esterase/lipase
MRRIGKTLGRVLLALVALAAAAWAFGPRSMAPTTLTARDVGADLDAWVATRNATPGIRAGDGDVLTWAAAPGQRTDWAVVYLHGFSASPEEIRPVPDDVARALNANLYIPRLTGHGLDSAAMATATAQDWLDDTATALAVGRQLGDRVLVIGTSTGATLATIALADPAQAKGVAGAVLISPNYGVAGTGGILLDLPWVGTWGPWVAGQTQSFTPLNDGQAAHWTTSYPTAAVLPLAALVRTARAIDHARITTPALFVFAETDRVVDPARTAPVIAAWGGPTEVQPWTPQAADDPMHHVIAGRVMSPDGTAAVVDRILGFVQGL